MRIGIAISRAASLTPTWTTVHLACCALRRGHAVYFIEPWDYEVTADGVLVARTYSFSPSNIDPKILIQQMIDRQAMRRYVDLSGLDLLLLRCAPLNLDVLTFALIAADLGLRVINHPTGALQVSHKGWLASLHDVPSPPTLVTRSLGVATDFFHRQHHGVVVKPARGSGGRRVAIVPREAGEHFDTAFRNACVKGGSYVVVQAYLPKAREGEKRLVWMDGEVLGGYLRQSAPGDFRHNLTCGAEAAPATLTTTDYALGAALSPHLLRLGIRLAGLDVIGNYITEVNALNPGGAFHSDRLNGSHLVDHIIERLESEYRIAHPLEREAYGFPPSPEQEAGPRHPR